MAGKSGVAAITHFAPQTLPAPSPPKQKTSTAQLIEKKEIKKMAASFTWR